MALNNSASRRQHKKPDAGNGRVVSAAVAEAPSSDLAQIIQPRVKDRWLGLIRRNYTAETVRNVLDGTNYGRMYYLHAMFELIEESWPRVGQNLHKIRSDVSRAEWIIHPHAAKGEKPSDEAQEKAKFVEELLWGMRTNPLTMQAGLVDVIYDLMDGYGKGLAVLEVDWQRKLDGVLAPIGTRWIRSVYYDYPIEHQAADRLMLSPSGRPETELVEFPHNKFIVGTFRWRSGPLASKIGLLRSLAPWWVYMNFSVDFLLALGQIFGIPIRWATYQQPQNKAVVSQMLEQMGAVAWAALPEGTNLNIQESGRSAADNPNAFLLKEANNLADLVILGQTLGQDVTSTGGNRALGEVHERVLTGRTRHAALWAGDVLTAQLVRPMILLNYGNEDECPLLVPKIDEAKDPQALAERDKILFVDMRLPVAVDFLYAAHGVPEPKDGDNLFVPPEPVAPVGNLDPNADPNAAPAADMGAMARNRQDAFAAVEDLETSDEVKAALSRLPEGLRAHYISELVSAEDYPGLVKPRYKRGQPGGGRYMSAKQKAAIAKVSGIMATWPQESQRGTERHIKAFGLPDNEAEWRAYTVPNIVDVVDERARDAKKLQTVKISALKTTQSKIDGAKVQAMLQSTADDSTDLVRRSPIVLKRSNKLWLWDGHHRAAKALALGRDEFKARVLDLEDLGT